MKKGLRRPEWHLQNRESALRSAVRCEIRLKRSNRPGKKQTGPCMKRRGILLPRARPPDGFHPTPAESCLKRRGHRQLDDPDPYLRAVKRSGIDPNECVAVEDSERGLPAAMRAGIRCLVVPSGLTRGRTFAGAHRVLASVSEIPTVLSEITRIAKTPEI
jgi:hypothetical protein